MCNIYIHNIYNIYYMILLLIFLLFFCNHDNLILKLHQKKIAASMKDGFSEVVSKLEVYQG